MAALTLAIAITALLLSVSGFILGLLGFIYARSHALSTHTITQAPQSPQQDLSQLFGNEEPVSESDFSVPNDKLEQTLLQGLN